MDTAIAAWLLDALVVIGLIVAVWLVLSPPAFISQLALRGVGALDFPGRAVGLAQRLVSFRPSFDRYLERVSEIADCMTGQGGVRVALNARHDMLGDALKRTEKGVRDAVRGVEGVTAADGPKSVLREIDALRERSKLVDRLAVDFEDDLEDQYVARSRAVGEFWVAAALVVLFVSMNSMMLNMFFKDLITVRFYGFPLSAAASMMFVGAEMGLGATLSWSSYRQNMRMLGWVCILGIGSLGLVEAVVLGIVSNEFELEFALFEQYPVLKAWLAPLGFVLVLATSAAGYMLHHAIHELAGHRGATRMRREMRAANAFVADLPRVWEGVDQKAQRAKASIDDYLLALKGKAGELGGIVNEIKGERERLSETLLAAHPNQWPSLIDGNTADRRIATAQNVGLFLLTVVAVLGYGTAAASLFITAAGPRLPDYASVGAALVVTIAFYVIGLFPFRRLRLTVGENGRAYPFPAGVVEFTVAGVVVFGGGLALVLAGVTVLGAWGVALGLIMTAGGCLLAVLGYFMERAVSGLGLIVVVFVTSIVFLVRTLAALLVFLAIWAVAAFAWIVTAVLAVLAKPTELIIELLRKKPTPQTVPTVVT